jgi:hypothetical protein
MTTAILVEQIADLLREAGGAHHRAFAATNGDDPAWPQWYAGHLAGPLGDWLGRPVAPDVLAAELAALDVAHRANAARSDWPRYYAERLVARYAAARV